MNKLRREIDSRRRREYRTTLHQRQYITQLLRQGYDDVDHEQRNQDFSLSFYTQDLSQNLTEPNKNYLASGYADEELNRLFGRIASRTIVDIASSEEGYIISLYRKSNDQTDK